MKDEKNMENFQEAETELEAEIEENAETEETAANPKKKKKRKKILLLILLLFVLLLIPVIIFIDHKLSLIDYDPGLDYTINTDQSFVDDEKVDFGEIDDVTGSSYQEILKKWALNSEAPKMSNKNVINVLLIGSDASAKESGRADVMENGNTDVMMLVSINTKDKTVKLVSFMRDSYTYLTGFDRFAKLNAACANGGPAYLVDTIENDYKIEIDGYVMVDFDSFVQCIDIVGGVTVDVPAGVGKSLNIPYGENVLLDGEQALNFCRVRKLYADGDISRTANQRKVVNSLISSCKTASISQINDVLDTILANVRTSFGKKDILSYATSALANNWANFTITQRTMPTADTRYGYSGSAWIWVVDYPLAAQKLQTELYGQTNIKLPENRTTAITVMGGYVTEDKGD